MLIFTEFFLKKHKTCTIITSVTLGHPGVAEGFVSAYFLLFSLLTIFYVFASAIEV